jgi:glycosyltransferase involved in cell wall biosynthesis
MPKVSYVIPSSRIVTNPDWVKKAVNSALNQTVQDVEVLVGDSTGTIPDYGDPRVSVMNLYGSTITFCINTLIKTSKSDVILLLCDDDFDQPNRAEVVLKELETCDVFCGSYNRVDVNGVYMNTRLTVDWDLNKFLLGLDIPVCAGGWKKSCPLWDDRFQHYNDFKFLVESHLLGLKIRTSTEVLSNFRIHYPQMCGSSPKRVAERLPERKLLREIWKELDWGGKG